MGFSMGCSVCDCQVSMWLLATSCGPSPFKMVMNSQPMFRERNSLNSWYRWRHRGMFWNHDLVTRWPQMEGLECNVVITKQSPNLRFSLFDFVETWSSQYFQKHIDIVLWLLVSQWQIVFWWVYLYIYIYAVLICLICFAYYMLHVSKCLIEGSLEVKLPTIWGDE